MGALASIKALIASGIAAVGMFVSALVGGRSANLPKNGTPPAKAVPSITEELSSQSVSAPQNEAAKSSDALRYRLVPSASVLREGEKLTVTVQIIPSVTGKKAKVAGLDLIYDPSLLKYNQADCDPGAFSSSAITKADENLGKVYLTCFKPGGSGDVVFQSGKPIVLGTIGFTVIGQKVKSRKTSTISVSRAVVPETDIYENLAGPSEPLDWEYTP